MHACMPLGDGIAFSLLQDMTWHPFSQGSLPQDVAPHFLTFTKEKSVAIWY